MRGDHGTVLDATNNLNPNLQFTLEELDRKGNLTFLDSNVKLDSRKQVSYGWFL